MVSEKPLLGIITFLLAVPFLYFIWHNNWQIGFERPIIGGVYIPLSAIYLFVLLMFFFINQYHSTLREVSNQESKIIKVGAIFILVAAPSLLFSKYPLHSLFFFLIDLVLPFFYFIVLMKSEINLKKLIIVLIISVTTFALFSLYYIYQKSSLSEITLGLYNVQGTKTTWMGFNVGHLLLIFPYTVLLYKLFKGWPKAFSGLLIVISGALIFFSNSRSAVLGLICAGIVFYYFYKIPTIKKIYFLVAGFLSAFILGFYFEFFFDVLGFHRIVTTIDAYYSGQPIEVITASRSAIWQSALEMIRDFPIFGIGADMWSHYIAQYSHTKYFHRDIFGVAVRYYSTDAHSIYLSTWLNYGVLGLISYVVLLCVAIKRGWENIQCSSSKEMRKYSLASFLALLIWVTSSLFGGGGFFIEGNLVIAIIFWSTIAVIFKLSGFQSAVKTQGDQRYA